MIDIILPYVRWKDALVDLNYLIFFCKTQAELVVHVPSVLRLLHQEGIIIELKKGVLFSEVVNSSADITRPENSTVVEH